MAFTMNLTDLTNLTATAIYDGDGDGEPRRTVHEDIGGRSMWTADFLEGGPLHSRSGADPRSPPQVREPPYWPLTWPKATRNCSSAGEKSLRPLAPSLTAFLISKVAGSTDSTVSVK
jgi:hypothetical protein